MINGYCVGVTQAYVCEDQDSVRANASFPHQFWSSKVLSSLHNYTNGAHIYLYSDTYLPPCPVNYKNWIVWYALVIDNRQKTSSVIETVPLSIV